MAVVYILLGSAMLVAVGYFIKYLWEKRPSWIEFLIESFFVICFIKGAFSLATTYLSDIGWDILFPFILLAVVLVYYALYQRKEHNRDMVVEMLIRENIKCETEEQKDEFWRKYSLAKRVTYDRDFYRHYQKKGGD